VPDSYPRDGGAVKSDGVMPVLVVMMVTGGGFADDERRVAATPTAVISDRSWRTRMAVRRCTAGFES